MTVSSDNNGVRTQDLAIAAVEEQFSTLFNRVRAAIRERALGVHPDLQPAGYKMLSALVRSGPAHAGELAELLATDKSVVSRQVRLLEQLGFVERQADPADRRASYLVATEAAVARIGLVKAEDRATLYRGLGTWPIDDIDRLAALLGRLNESMMTPIQR